MEGEVNNELADVIMHRRAIFEQAYIQLRQAHPSLPAQLHEFQDTGIQVQLCSESSPQVVSTALAVLFTLVDWVDSVVYIY